MKKDELKQKAANIKQKVEEKIHVEEKIEHAKHKFHKTFSSKSDE
jgi:hypothetical protein